MRYVNIFIFLLLFKRYESARAAADPEVGVCPHGVAVLAVANSVASVPSTSASPLLALAIAAVTSSLNAGIRPAASTRIRLPSSCPHCGSRPAVAACSLIAGVGEHDGAPSNAVIRPPADGVAPVITCRPTSYVAIRNWWGRASSCPPSSYLDLGFASAGCKSGHLLPLLQPDRVPSW